MDFLKKLTLLIFVLIISKHNLNAQVEYRIGLGLYEITEIYSDGSLSHPHPWVNSHQILNNVLLEHQNKRSTHRLSARYINLNHSLKNKDWKPYTEWAEDGNFKRSGFDFGYEFLYSFGKKKRFYTGLGIAYKLDKMQSPMSKNTKVDLTSHSIAPSFILEGNIQLHNRWYISPSFRIMMAHNFSSSNSEPQSENLKATWPTTILQITPIRFTLKRTFFTIS